MQPLNPNTILDQLAANTSWNSFNAESIQLSRCLTLIDSSLKLRVEKVFAGALGHLLEPKSVDDPSKQAYLEISTFLRQSPVGPFGQLAVETVEKIADDQFKTTKSLLGSFRSQNAIKLVLAADPIHKQPLMNKLIEHSRYFTNFESICFFLAESPLTFEEKCQLVELYQGSSKPCYLYEPVLFKTLETNDLEFFDLLLGLATEIKSKGGPLNRYLSTELIYQLPITSEINVLEFLVYLTQVKHTTFYPETLQAAFTQAPPAIWNFVCCNYTCQIRLEDLLGLITMSYIDPDKERVRQVLQLTDLHKKYGAPLLQAISQNLTCFACTLIEMGSTTRDCWEPALKTGNLEILEAIFKKDHLSKRKTDFIQEILKFNSNLEELIAHLFLGSSLESLKKFIYDLRGEKTLLESLMGWGAVVARYSNPLSYTDIKKHYGFAENKSFMRSQMEFGKMFHQLISKTLANINLSERKFFDIFQDWAQVRGQRVGNDVELDNFCNLRQTNTRLNTPISFNSSSRYAFVRPFIQEEFQRQSLKYEDHFFSFTHCYKGIELTSVAYNKYSHFQWNHTLAHNMLQLLPELESLYSELMQNKELSLNELDRKVATFYWLGCQMMLTKRGNAQYFLMFMSLIYRHHGLQPKIPKRETPMVDCIALTLSLDPFVERFATFFEPG